VSTKNNIRIKRTRSNTLHCAIYRLGKVLLVGRLELLCRKTVEGDRSLAQLGRRGLEHGAAEHIDVGALPQQTRNGHVFQMDSPGPFDLAGVFWQCRNQFLRNVTTHQITAPRAELWEELSRIFFLGDIPEGKNITIICTYLPCKPYVYKTQVR